MAKITIKTELCKGCGLCVNACPKGIIELSTELINGKGYHPAQAVHPESCVGCAFCAMMCPDVAIVVEK